MIDAPVDHAAIDNDRRTAAHQLAALAMQKLAHPLTEVPALILVQMRLAQLDDVFWRRKWEEFASSAYDIWEASRARLTAQLADAGRE
jgi:hypothetical protein